MTCFGWVCFQSESFLNFTKKIRFHFNLFRYRTSTCNYQHSGYNFPQGNEALQWLCYTRRKPRKWKIPTCVVVCVGRGRAGGLKVPVTVHGSRHQTLQLSPSHVTPGRPNTYGPRNNKITTFPNKCNLVILCNCIFEGMCFHHKEQDNWYTKCGFQFVKQDWPRFTFTDFETQRNYFKWKWENTVTCFLGNGLLNTP